MSASVVSSRRNSTTSSIPPSSSASNTSQPSTPTSKCAPPTPMVRARKSGGSLTANGTQRKINPIRRCQSYRVPNGRSTNSNGSISSQTSLRSSRRVSSQPHSLQNSKLDNEFVKYYQYKTSRVDPCALLNITIIDDQVGSGQRISSNGNMSKVLVLGAPGAGKTTLIAQFSNYLEENFGDGLPKNRINEHHHHHHSNGITSNANGGNTKLLLNFCEVVSLDDCLPLSPMSIYPPDAYMLVYAVNDRDSFVEVEKLISEIQKWDDVESKPIILVANKTDLVRSRTVSKQEGRQLAINHHAKYIETSCPISLNIDFLLAGIGAQIKLKSKERSEGHTASRKMSMFRRLLKRAALLSKSKSCDNLNVL